jgi:hypothetical protein
MFPDYPSLTATNSALEPDRIERVGRVCVEHAC